MHGADMFPFMYLGRIAFIALTLLVGRQEGRPVH